VQTLLPMTPTGELCDLDGKCVDAADDEMFKLTTQVRVCYLLFEVSCLLLVIRRDARQSITFNYGLFDILYVCSSHMVTWV
jgi:hypothetical protein